MADEKSKQVRMTLEDCLYFQDKLRKGTREMVGTV